MNLRSRNQSIVTGVAVFLVAVLATVNGYAQPDRHSRNRVTQPAAMLAQQTTATTCPNPTGSDSQARAAREATRNGRLDLAIDAWNAAIQMCPSPDLFEGLGRAHEGLAALAVDDQHRLTSLEAELGAFRQALTLAQEHPVQGFSTDSLQARINALEPVVQALRRRLTAIVVPPHTTATCANTQTDVANCGACGHRCDAGLTCTAGACRAVIATPPSVTTPAPSRVAPLAMIVSGGALTLAGGTILGIGIAARSAADADEATLARSGCSLPSRPASCANYQAGATTPASVAAWATPLGGTLLGLGIVDTIVGSVWYARSAHPTNERPHLSGWYTPSGGGLSLTGTF